jgi:hypothetical protein
MAALAGCSNEVPEGSSKDEITEDDPFDANSGRYGGGSGTIAKFGFGPVASLNKGSGPVAFDYNGGNLVIDYFIENNSSDAPLEFGLFVFLDGIPQPFKIDDPNEEDSFLHVFNLDENEHKEFKIVFTPILGKTGETLEISFVGIYNPSFMPDSENIRYGMNHKMSTHNPYKLIFHENTAYTGQDKLHGEEILKNVSYSEEEISTDMRKEYENEDENRLDKSIFIELFEEGNYVRYNNYKIVSGGKKTVPLIFRGFGKEGVAYRTTFYLNHRPIGIQGYDYLEWNTIKGSIAEFKMDLDVSQMEGSNTLYSISVPIESDKFIEKTDSMNLKIGN